MRGGVVVLLAALGWGRPGRVPRPVPHASGEGLQFRLSEGKPQKEGAGTAVPRPPTTPLSQDAVKQLLASLPPRDKRAGFIEAIKVALIRDRQFFD